MPQPELETESTPVAIRITALVIAHNRPELLRKCLLALEQSAQREQLEILVVDNGSTGGSSELRDEFPGVRFTPLPRNFGLTKALNIGVRSSAGEFILLLHDDVEVSPATAAGLASILEAQGDVGAVCPRLTHPDGSGAPQVARLPVPGDHDVEWRAAFPGSDAHAVEYARGAAIMVRSFFLRAMRQIDERYGQFGSDAELCRQVQRAAKQVQVAGSLTAIDHGTPTTNALRRADFELGLAAYLGKHYGFAAGLKARAGSMLRALRSFSLLRYVWGGQKIDGTQPGA
ncbi:MAG: glycosyltransferase [Candidatus Solibacter usitatus]|nr:glycosyltransferase [Candidatus Solibacter usitatus]